MKALVQFLINEDGPTAVEYAIMLAIILGVCFVGITLLGNATAESFEDSRDQINTAFTANNGS